MANCNSTLSLKKCLKGGECRAADCTRMHPDTNKRVLAFKVMVTCGCPIYFPMPNLEGFNEIEKDRIRKEAAERTGALKVGTKVAIVGGR